MKKSDAIAKIEALVSFRESEQARFQTLAESEQSNDEKSELLKLAKKNSTHAKYLKRITANAVLCDAVASQISQLKISDEQIDEIEQDAYSLRKFAELMISFVQKRKVADEHSFSEALAVLASGVTESDATSYGKKMTAKDGSAYGARQAQMSLKLLERLKALDTHRDGNRVIFAVNADSAVYKRIMSAYE